MTVQSFDTVKNHNKLLIRKALEGSIFIKPYDEADAPITKIWTTAGGLIIPTGFVDVGLLNKKSAQKWARDTDSADTESFGYGEPTRRDITKDISTVDFSMQESKRRTLELYNGADYSGVVADTDGNIVIDKPSRPQVRLWTLLSLSKDGDAADAIYFARIMPMCQVTKIGDQTLGEDEELLYPVTMTGYREPAYKTAVREIWGGPGIDKAAMGFGA